jgi:hypothetical protein
MNNIKKISGLLSSATCTLLGAAQVQAADGEWDVETAVLAYSEKDRVTAFEPVVKMKKELNDTDTLNLKLTLDALTGASATGAVPSSVAQTYTRPSGNGSYNIAPNETPLDDTFHDTRAQINADWDQAMDSNNRLNLGVHFSREFDFTSLGGSASWTHEMNQKNTALTGGINLELDNISPIGGIPVAKSTHPSTLDGTLGQSIARASSDDDRTVFDVLVGVTQIIDRSSLFQVNLSLSQADGYMTDPFKMVSIVDANPASASFGEPNQVIYEARPDSRSKTSLFGKYKKQFANDDIFTVSLRLMTDDWGVDSETIDVTYRFRMDSGYYIQPHVRLYTQSAADFYRYFLRDDEAVPQYVSADYRLGEMDSTTVGIKVGKSNKFGHDWSVRIEQYVQSGDSHPAVAIGQLVNQNLYPDVEAIIVQASYSFKW